MGNLSSCVAGYPGPGVIEGTVVLGQTHQMSDLQGAWCITGDLEISGSTLVDLTGLETLAAIGGTVRIQNNTALTSVAGLGRLRVIGWGLYINNNPELASLTELAGLREIHQDLRISDNAKLPACWVWTIAKQVGGRDMSYCTNNMGIGSCGTLPEGFVCEPGATGPGVLDTSVYLYPSPYGGGPSLRDFGGVTCITGSLGISGTTSTDLSELSTLVAVGGGLSIYDNSAPVTVEGLAGLTSVGWNLTINSNPVLSSLAGLRNLTSLAQAPSISDNPALPACWAERLATQVGQTCSCWENNGSDTCP
jgi:hypothetical protein